jgi:hypothetical protein
MRARSQHSCSGHIPRECPRGSLAIVGRFGFCSAMGVIRPVHWGQIYFIRQSSTLAWDIEYSYFGHPEWWQVIRGPIVPEPSSLDEDCGDEVAQDLALTLEKQICCLWHPRVSGGGAWMFIWQRNC